MRSQLAKFIPALKAKPVFPVVVLQGVIAPNYSGTHRPNSISMRSHWKALNKAFETKECDAVGLWVDSPGGSPVQSALLHDHVRFLAEKHSKRVVVFISDVGASGGYWIATAGDDVFAHPSSIVGSVGVISNLYVVKEAMEKLGITSYTWTEGDKKQLFDPFKHPEEEEVARLKHIQKLLYQQFREHVENARGPKLTASMDEIASGEFWVGSQALELGLIDGFSNPWQYAAKNYPNAEVKFVAPRAGFFDMLRGGPTSMAESFAATLTDSVWNKLQMEHTKARFQ